MKNLKTTSSIFSLLTALFFITSVSFAQTTWDVDPAHAKVTFSTVHNTISDVDGLFNKFSSKVTTNTDNFSDAVFELKVDVASIDTEIKMRDDHLRSADFFEVEKYPEMTFKSTGIKATDVKNRYKLTGDLTMHGVTKEVVLDLWYRGTIKDDKNKRLIAGFQITGKLNRLDFGVGPKFPEFLISNEVIIKADGEYITKQ